MTLPEQTLQCLQEFAIADHVAICPGHGGLPKIDLDNSAGSAEIYLFGGLVHRFQPAGQKDVLWGSERAVYDGQKAIRAGIPICWPWFGPHPSQPDFPSHGFARNRTWQIESSNHDVATNTTAIQISLQSNESTIAWFPHQYRVLLDVTVSTSLTVALTMHNESTSVMQCSPALHTYIAVSEIENTLVDGLQGVSFIDNLDGRKIDSETSKVAFSTETERVYTQSPHDVIVETPKRKVRISKTGSQSTVVWNPWIEKARATSDMGDDEYRTMLCVESANVGEDAQTIDPGQNHLISQTISVE